MTFTNTTATASNQFVPKGLSSLCTAPSMTRLSFPRYLPSIVNVSVFPLRKTLCTALFFIRNSFDFFFSPSRMSHALCIMPPSFLSDVLIVISYAKQSSQSVLYQCYQWRRRESWPPLTHLVSFLRSGGRVRTRQFTHRLLVIIWLAQPTVAGEHVLLVLLHISDFDPCTVPCGSKSYTCRVPNVLVAREKSSTSI